MIDRVKTSKTVRRLARPFQAERHRRRHQRLFVQRMSQLDPDAYFQKTTRPDHNVIIVTIDCLRNSHLSCWGYHRQTTPFLDTFPSKFRAISAAPHTYPSVPSILTGLYPHNHGAVLGGRIKDWRDLTGRARLTGNVVTLPEILHMLGHETYFGATIMPAHLSMAGRAVPVIYDELTNAGQVLRDAARWIQRQARGCRVFCYLHLGDLHIPICPPRSFRDYFARLERLPLLDSWDFFRPDQRTADPDGYQRYRHNRTLLYDNTLRYVDRMIEAFHGDLRTMGLLGDTVFVVTADHGEEFWEHADLEAKAFYRQYRLSGVSHGHSVFNEVIEVPLLMSGPFDRVDSKEFLSTVDIVPTILDLLQVSHRMRFDGCSVLRGDVTRPLLSESVSMGYEKKALVVGSRKLIYSPDDGVEWLFDLERDPEEQKPIVDHGLTAPLVTQLLQILRDDERRRIRRTLIRRVTTPSR